MARGYHGMAKQIKYHRIDGATLNLMENLWAKNSLAFMLGLYCAHPHVRAKANVVDSGDDNMQARVAIPHAFCVMDWFQVFRAHLSLDNLDSHICLAMVVEVH
jgi:hypothetical protein